LTGQSVEDRPAAVETGAGDTIYNTADSAAVTGTAAVPDSADPYLSVKPPSERMKYVAVVETDIDEQSGATAELTNADARLVTAELRREAVKNLPRARYSVMTSETVIAQGSAVLEKCADENCVITLGSTIGADFIVRGTISKVQTRFTLTVEIYETDDGNLVASSDPIRSETVEGLLEKTAEVCAEMYRTFVAEHTPPPEPVVVATTVPAVTPVVQEPPSRPRMFGTDISAGVGAVYAGGFGGGIAWSDGQVSMPYSGGGVYLFVSHTYATAHIAYLSGGGRWESDNRYNDKYDLPNTQRIDLNIGLLGKYPITLWENISVFPAAGLDYNACASAKLVRNDGSLYTFNGKDGRQHMSSDLNELWLRFGAGADIDIGRNAYMRGEILYGARLATEFEMSYLYDNGRTKPAYGLLLRVGAGIRL
jgi:TolB-like protein